MIKHRVFVAQCADKDNNNAQVLNSKALLNRLNIQGIEWIVPHYGDPDPELINRSNIRLVKYWRNRLWKWHKFLLYQSPVEAIFYPGPYLFDDLALQLRRRTWRKVPVIATLEGLVGGEDREKKYSQWAGHPVYCQRIESTLLSRVDRVLSEADHVIAISPFLARMGRHRYGNKFSFIPLGVDIRKFTPVISRRIDQVQRFRVISVGSIQECKRPELFIKLALRFPQSDFVWIGEGNGRLDLLKIKEERRINNVFYPGLIPHDMLPAELHKSNLFLLPSNSEGVPKVTQEAASCGLPVIIFGFYEAPSVVDGENGYVVWNDEEMFARVGELINSPEMARSMGIRGAEMAKEWNWDVVARRWEDRIRDLIT